MEPADRNQYKISLKNLGKKHATLVKQISVDLDHNSVIQLLRVYLSAKRILPDVPMEIKVSSSGVGYHIKLFKQVTVEQDLKIRALLWDHADRLVYAIKKWALNPCESYVDLVFNEKNMGKETTLPLTDILKVYDKEVKDINNLLSQGDNGAADAKVKELAKKIEPEIQKYKTASYVGCIAFADDDLREPLEKCCSSISEKDATFTWKMYPCWFPEYSWILAFFGTDKDKLWKRLVWFKNNAYNPEDPDKKLLLKDADTRLFIKERKST